MSAELSSQIKITADASGVEAGVGRAKKSVASLGKAASDAGKDAAKGIDGIGDSGGKAAQKVDAATKNMIASIQRTTAVLESGGRSNSKFFEVLASQRGVDVNALRPYLDQLDAVAAKQVNVSNALGAGAIKFNEYGLSAKQTTAALRQVPAQLTDIIVSLQGGQAPLTVLLQQGGQLRDIFGGIAPAARALGSAVLRLVNPYTLAATAVAALGVAYNQGSKEADAYARAVILSGNAAGVTVGQLKAMAQAISANVGTQSAAAEALAQIATNGRIAGAQMQRIGEVAVRMEKLAGQAVSETVKQFAELGRSPVEASAKLNESTNFLTASLYQQIKALEDQGRTAEAAALAQKAYADALEQRLPQLQDRLGYIERAWAGVTGEAKRAWDAMLNVGRSDTLQDQLAKVQRQIQQAQGSDPNRRFSLPFDTGLDELKRREAALRENIKFENQSATAAASAAAQTRARIEFDKEGEKYLSNKVRMEREIAQARTLGAQAGATQAEIEQRIAGIREKFKGPKGSDTSRVDSRAKALLDIEDIKTRAEALTTIYTNSERIMEAQRAAGLMDESEYYAAKKAFLELNTRAQIDALNAENTRLNQEKLNTKDGLDRDRKVLENNAKIAKLQADATASQIVLDIQAESAIKKREAAMLSARQAAQDYYDTINRQQERDLSSVGMGDRQRNLNAGISQIEDRYSGQRRDLENQKALAIALSAEGKLTSEQEDQFKKRLALIDEFQTKSVESYKRYYDRLIDLQGRWDLGVNQAMQNYVDQASNTFKQTGDLAATAFKGMEDALVSFVKTGKLDFKSFADMVAAQITRIIIQQQLAAAIGGKAGGGGDGWLGEIAKSLIGSLFGSSGMTAPGTSDLTSFTGRAIGGPVSAGGIYRVNEQGPELLNVAGNQYLMMGNQSGSVSPDVSGGGSSTVIHVNVTAPPNTSRSSATQWGSEAARQMQHALSRTGG